MARRLLSTMLRMRGGPTIGGSGTRLHVYDDEALTTPSAVYRRGSGAGEQPNPLLPNAGRGTTLSAARLAADAFVDVVSVASFQVGDLVPIYDLVNTVYKVVTAIDSGLGRLTLDEALGFDFDDADTSVGNADMRGHVWGWLEDVRDYYVQTEDVGSGRVMPPLVIPAAVPTSALNFEDEGVSTGSARSILNFTGIDLKATDNPGATRVDVRYNRHSLWVAGVL